LEFFKIHNFLDEIKMVETKLNVMKHSISLSSTSTTIRKRKRIHNINTEKDVLTTTVTVAEDEEVPQSLGKHLKCN
jgi:hypothetical protein